MAKIYAEKVGPNHPERHDALLLPTFQYPTFKQIVRRRM
jgi:hypothetical protein